MQKPVFFIVTFCLMVSIGCAQTIIPNDSVVLGAGANATVFYKLSDGAKKGNANTWHLALSVQPTAFPNNTLQGVSIRSNGGIGVEVYQIPGFTQDSFSVAVDTTGYKSWNREKDSDTLMDFGALNNASNISSFNYGWGVYGGPPSYNVVGRRVYLVTQGTTIKKFMVDALERDTAWVIRYADPDNSNLKTWQISKKDFQGRNYMYLNLVTDAQEDLEPSAYAYDLNFTKYAAADVFPDSTYPVVGVLVNKGVQTARLSGVDVNADYTAAASYTKRHNAIGWDWKFYDYQNSVFQVQDSLLYYILAKDGQLFKLIFTGYSGSASGIIYFYKENVSPSTGISEAVLSSLISVYPNPAQNVIYFNSPFEDQGAVLGVYNLSGQLLFSRKMMKGVNEIEAASLDNGLYICRIEAEGAIYSSKVSISR